MFGVFVCVSVCVCVCVCMCACMDMCLFWFFYTLIFILLFNHVCYELLQRVSITERVSIVAFLLSCDALNNVSNITRTLV